MQITTLGALAIDGRTVEGSRLPALLTPLLLARGRIVPAADLVEAVWAGAPPADAAGALQALVTRARRLGLTVTATAGGYRLDPTGVEVDALVAQDRLAGARAAMAAGDRARAIDLAGRGLLLWADDDAPAAGPSGRVFVDLLAVRMEAALAAIGGPGGGTGAEPDDDSLDALRRAVHDRPTDEPLTDLLMRSLAARGRESEALAAFAALQTELAETYGADPSAAVRATHLALLRGELTRERPRLEKPRELPRWRRPTTPMLGRAADVAALELTLAAHPLVTLVAVGGAGKTRLAVEVARRATERGDAVRAVELAGLREPAEILPALLSALGAAETAADAEDLRGRRALDPRLRMLGAVASLDGLLVLDNCEHLLEAVAELTAELITAAAPGLHVLATSRAPLGVVGEMVHPVRTLTDDAALALLHARARAVRPSLAWDAATALELCHRLDNLPLALELAAARLRSMPLGDVLAGIEDRFALLDHALRGLPDRHAGLWAMVDWSWALLDPAGRALLRDLAVVPAPVTAELAAAVAGLAGGTVARGGLAGLVDQSLLTLEEPADGRPARYRMLETVREYGDARLGAGEARAAAMWRLASWAASASRELRLEYVGDHQLEALRASSDDHDTLVAALRWSTDHALEREAFAVAAALFTVWTMRGLHVEVITWARRLLHADTPALRRKGWELLRSPHGPDGPAGPDPDDVAAVAFLSVLNSGITNDRRTAALALRLSRWAASAPAGAVSVRTAGLAQMASQLGTADEAAHLAAADVLISASDPYLHAVGLLARASVRENRGDVLELASDARDAYAFFESIGDHWGMGMSAQVVGQWEAGRDGEQTDEWLTRAAGHLDLIGAVQDARALRVVRDMRRALNGSADAAAALAETVSSQSSSPQERSTALIALGVLAALDGRPEEAVDRGDQAVSAAREGRQVAAQGRIVTEVAAAVLRIRAGREGEGLLAVAARAAFTLTDMPVLGMVALGYAELARDRGELARSDELWALGMRLGANLGLMFGSVPAVGDLVIVANDVRAGLLEQARAMRVQDTIARLATLIHPR